MEGLQFDGKTPGKLGVEEKVKIELVFLPINLG